MAITQESNGLSAAPVLSTPDTHILSEIEPVTQPEPSQRLSDDQFIIRYEIQRTVQEIQQNRWKRIALQFPDQMLPDSARVYQMLARGLSRPTPSKDSPAEPNPSQAIDFTQEIQRLDNEQKAVPVKLTILGDTSYGSCCVDEIAAEHVDADAVVHYGRSCLSPTTRLPVHHVFTVRDLDHDAVCKAFVDVFKDKTSKVVVTTDTPYMKHIDPIVAKLESEGYTNLYGASIIHDPSSLIPNRTLPASVKQDQSTLSEWDLFHISDPPTSLLLTLSSRMKSVHICPTTFDASTTMSAHQANASPVLRRRYALIASLGTVSTWGILINTLSVQNYLNVVDHIKKSISDAGKKSYLFVVGKLNTAKVANFADIEGWVVIGCWESSLIDSKDFYKPIITPFELDLVLAGDDNRIWTGRWRSDFQSILDSAQDEDTKVDDSDGSGDLKMPGTFVDDAVEDEDEKNVHDYDSDSEEESAPPEFDLRTGRYVSHTRPIQSRSTVPGTRRVRGNGETSTAIVKRSNGELLAVRGVASPAAEFLAQKRTWRGLGSDFEIRYDDDDDDNDNDGNPGALVEEGQTGLARGYTVADSARS